MTVNRFQKWAAVHMPLLVYGAFYFFLVVLGNILMAIYGAKILLGYRTDFLSFPETFSFGFWALLLAPFFIVPPIYVVSRRFLHKLVERFVSVVPSVGTVGFGVVAVMLFGWIAWAMVIADAVSLVKNARDALESIEARLAIQARLGFLTMVVLQGLATFWSFVAIIQALRKRGVWIALALASVVCTTIFLVILSMKWPVVLFYIGITVCVFSFSRRWILGTAAGVATLIVIYFLISTFVFRITNLENAMKAEVAAKTTSVPPPVERAPSGPSSEKAAPPASAPTTPPPAAAPSVPATKDVMELVYQSASYGPFFLRTAIVRLANVYPYYYHEVAANGLICNGDLSTLFKRGACRPAKVIYDKMYPEDRFLGRGTSNISAHVTAYALGGWPLAIVVMVVSAVVLAVFSCIPLEACATAAAFRVAGVLAAYHLTQIPIEGFALYDHGVVWVALLIAIYGVASRLMPQR